MTDHLGVSRCDYCGSEFRLRSPSNGSVQELTSDWKKKHESVCRYRTPNERRKWAKKHIALNDVESDITIDLSHVGFEDRGIDGVLHLYAQEWWHDDARIAGTKDALILLRDALNEAIENGASICEDVFTSDGEGYDVHIIEVSKEQTTHMAVPYAGDDAKERRKHAFWPSLRDEFYRYLNDRVRKNDEQTDEE